MNAAEKKKLAAALAPEKPRDPNALTPAERRVALEVAKGYTDREIAEALGISHQTVRNHLGRVYRKLGVHTRLRLALALHEAKITR